METSRVQKPVANIRKKLLILGIFLVVNIVITTACIIIYNKIRGQEGQRPCGQSLAQFSSNVTEVSVTLGSPTTALTATETVVDSAKDPTTFAPVITFSTPFLTPVGMYSDNTVTIVTTTPTTELSIQTTSSTVNGTSDFTLSSQVKTYSGVSTDRTSIGSVPSVGPTTELPIPTTSYGVNGTSGFTLSTPVQTSSVLSTERTTSEDASTCQPNLSTTSDYPTDCSEIHIAVGVDAIYTIYPSGSTNKTALVNCMSTCDGIWTVIQRRFDGSVDFYRNWTFYKEGFGDASGEYWLGNDAIHQLTSRSNYRLKVVLKDWDNVTVYAIYDTFSISNESDGYRLTVRGFHGDTGDSLSSHDRYMFSTRDRDNDIHGVLFCAERSMGAWWYIVTAGHRV